MASIAQEQHDGKRQETQNFTAAQRVLAEDFQDVGEQGDAGAEKNQADDIERIGAFAIVRKVALNKI